MLGILSPALTPLKAKAILFIAGAVIVGLLALGGTCWFLWNSLEKAQLEKGILQADLATSVKTNEDNVTVWNKERDGYLAQIQTQKDLAEVARTAAAEERAKQKKFDRALRIALNTLKETANAEAAEWSRVPIPDVIVRGMCRASAAASNEVATCDPDDGSGGGDPGAPAAAVPDHPSA